VPLSAAQRVTALEGSLDYLIQLQSAQLLEWTTSGMPPSFSVDGESYQWGAWLASIDAAIEAKLEQKQKASGPFIVRSRGRA
jgi:hypothetical protein